MPIVIRGLNPSSIYKLSVVGLSAGNIYRTWTGADHTHRDVVARLA
jgi:hypothetical protein